MYTKLGLVNGDTLSDSHLQHIEEGILSIEDDVKNFKEKKGIRKNCGIILLYG